jgi:hypothetical protein
MSGKEGLDHTNVKKNLQEKGLTVGGLRNTQDRL